MEHSISCCILATDFSLQKAFNTINSILNLKHQQNISLILYSFNFIFVNSIRKKLLNKNISFNVFIYENTNDNIMQFLCKKLWSSTDYILILESGEECINIQHLDKLVESPFLNNKFLCKCATLFQDNYKLMTDTQQVRLLKIHPRFEKTINKTLLSTDFNIFKKTKLKDIDMTNFICVLFKLKKERNFVELLKYIDNITNPSAELKFWCNIFKGISLFNLNKKDYLLCFLNAYHLCQDRCEPFYYLAKYEYKNGNFDIAYIYIKKSCEIGYPVDNSFKFINEEIYSKKFLLRDRLKLFV